MEADNCDLESVIEAFCRKLANIVVQSRLGKKVHTSCRERAASNDWFSISTEDLPEVEDEVRRLLRSSDILRRTLHAPAAAAAEAAAATLQFGVEISLRSCDGVSLALENWTAHVTCLPAASGATGTDSAALRHQRQQQQSLNSTVSQLGMLLRSLLVLTRLADGYNLSRQQTPDSHIILYRIFLGHPDLDALGESPSVLSVGEVVAGAGAAGAGDGRDNTATVTVSVHCHSRTTLTVTRPSEPGGGGGETLHHQHHAAAAPATTTDRGSSGETASSSSAVTGQCRAAVSGGNNNNSNSSGGSVEQLSRINTANTRTSSDSVEMTAASLSSSSTNACRFTGESSSDSCDQQQQRRRVAAFADDSSAGAGAAATPLASDQCDVPFARLLDSFSGGGCGGGGGGSADDHYYSTSAMSTTSQSTPTPATAPPHPPHSPIVTSQSPPETCDDFVMVELRTPFSDTDSMDGELGHFFRRAAPPPLLQSASAQRCSPAPSTSSAGGGSCSDSCPVSLAQQLDSFQQKSHEYDDMIAQLSRTGLDTGV